VQEAVVKKHAAKWIVPFLKYGVGFGLLGYVIYKYWDPRAGAPGLGQLLQGPIAVEALALALLVYTGAAMLQLYRWYLLVRALELPTTVRNAYRLGLIGVYYNTFFPGSVGGDLLKAYFIAHAHPERKTRAVASVIADRALGLYGLILFAAVSGSVAWALGDPRITANPELQWIVKVTATIAGTTALGFLLLGLLPQRRVDRFAGRLRAIPKLGTSLSELWYVVWVYRQRLKVVALCLVLSACAHFGLVLAFHSASRVFPPANPDTELATLPEHMVIAPIGFIAQAVPIAPGGVGVGEAIFGWLYKLSDRPESRGIISRLALRLTEWIFCLLGYIVYLRMRAEVREIQHEVEEGEDKQEPGDGRQETGEVPSVKREGFRSQETEEGDQGTEARKQEVRSGTARV
jgi:uncharacterized membrane protein YbhN (UPF0104 family)